MGYPKNWVCNKFKENIVAVCSLRKIMASSKSSFYKSHLKFVCQACSLRHSNVLLQEFMEYKLSQISEVMVWWDKSKQEGQVMQEMWWGENRGAMGRTRARKEERRNIWEGRKVCCPSSEWCRKIYESVLLSTTNTCSTFFVSMTCCQVEFSSPSERTLPSK